MAVQMNLKTFCFFARSTIKPVIPTLKSRAKRASIAKVGSVVGFAKSP